MRYITYLLLVSVLFFGACSKSFTGISTSDLKTSLGNNNVKQIGDGHLQSDVVSEGNPDGFGLHQGELKYLQVSVEYLDPQFIRDDKYPGFYIGQEMKYLVRIQNLGKRTFQHIDVIAVHEYFETDTINRYWVSWDDIYTFYKGQPLPGSSEQIWSDLVIGPGQEIVLSGTYTPPNETASGLDQTHIKIKHTNEGPEHAALLYDNPVAGIFCPPPPKL